MRDGNPIALAEILSDAESSRVGEGMENGGWANGSFRSVSCASRRLKTEFTIRTFRDTGTLVISKDDRDVAGREDGVLFVHRKN
jgi:hypothetical protein